jgi:membrane-associated phospholipid phosphatase
LDYTRFAHDHALAILVVAHLVVPAACVSAWRVLATRAAAVKICAALVTMALCIGVFVVIARRVAKGAAFAAADQHLLDAIRDGVPALASPIFMRLTHLGDPWFLWLLCGLVCVALLLKRRVGLAVYLAMAAAAGGLVNTALKLSMQRTRPTGALVPLPESFSFPSGHTYGSMVCYGLCAYMLMRLAPGRWDGWIVALASFVVLMIGTSRMVIGVHFPGDVIGGFAAGGAWLAACVGLAESVRRSAGVAVTNAR